MRVCPKCGYVDPDVWRPHKWRLLVDYCSISEFEDDYPETAEQFKKHEVALDENYAYLRAGKGKLYVQRIWRPLYEAGGKSAFYAHSEHVDHFIDAQQTRLLAEPQQKEILNE